jgi:hypothetical protein
MRDTVTLQKAGGFSEFFRRDTYSPAVRQTPDEMYFGTGHSVPIDLEANRNMARAARMAANRARSCRVCRVSVLKTSSPRHHKDLRQDTIAGAAAVE